MVGITSYGAYIPKYRLGRDVIAKAWGPRFLSGERAVANYDEDSLTMATEAALKLPSGDRFKIGGGIDFRFHYLPLSGETGIDAGGHCRRSSRRDLYGRPSFFHSSWDGCVEIGHGCCKRGKCQEHSCDSG